MSKWETYLAKHKSQALEELLDFLRIPSISAIPANAPDVQRAAEWVARRLTSAGFEHVQIMATGGHPIVYGDWLHAKGKPTIMGYAHFDVQPVDPLDKWTSPPFEPVVKDGRVYARGVSDDKGGLLTYILAAEAILKSTGNLPVNLKFFFEGQEEISSPQVPSFIAANRDLLACDMIVSADGSQRSEDTPCILVGLRGECGLQINVQGPSHDLHSGLYGGTVQNPIHALVRLLDSLHGPDGHILVDGFYDGAPTVPDEDHAQIAEVPFDEADFKAQAGVDALYGEEGYTPLERTWARPTIEINGIWGGFQGEGSKTVITSEAHAKITCRLVPGQDPVRILSLISKHVTKNTPKGSKALVELAPATSLPYLMPYDHPGNKAAHAVLEELYGVPPHYIRTGGSIAVYGLFLQMLNAYSVTFGFGLNDEFIHAPNEFFRLINYERGKRAFCMLLEHLGK